MPRDYKVYLEDILDAAEKIRSFIAGQSFETFRQDARTLDAVIRNLEVIGEAGKKIPEQIRLKNPEVDWKRIAGLRDILIHEVVQLVKGGFSYRARKELGFRSEIWQRGFADQYIADAGGFEMRRQYIRGNPLEAKLVARVEEYPYSSAYSGFSLDPMPEHLSG